MNAEGTRMTTQRYLSQEELLAWVNGLLQERRVVAPVRNGEHVFLQPLAGAEEVDLTYGQTVNSLKEFFFPATEAILRVYRGKRNARLEALLPEGKQVLLGIRPCDAAALTSMDALFLGEPADPYYGTRRQNTLLVGLACLEVPTAECFCTTTGGSPVGTTNLDVLLYPQDQGYIAEPLTEAGRALLGKVGQPLEEPFVPEEPEMPRCPRPTEEAWRRVFDDGLWERLGERCLGCKICTYNCPTCYCFDIRDWGAGGKVVRLRAWDACTSKHFYIEASGHDPRPTRGLHLRNRFAHKYFYFPWRYEQILLCSGCGRCVAQCPVNIDITEVLEEVDARAKAAND